jgi:hypothetical protein
LKYNNSRVKQLLTKSWCGQKRPHPTCWFSLLGEVWKQLNSQAVYVLDSHPIAACDNDRICRSRRYTGEAWRGRQASKKRYFYGVKVHIMVTEAGQPVEFFLTPGSTSDTTAYRSYDFDLPDQAWITADKAYTDYEVEDVINEAGLRMRPMRKKNSIRPVVRRVGSLLNPPFYCHADYLSKFCASRSCQSDPIKGSFPKDGGFRAARSWTIDPRSLFV